MSTRRQLALLAARAVGGAKRVAAPRCGSLRDFAAMPAASTREQAGPASNAEAYKQLKAGVTVRAVAPGVSACVS